MNIIFHVPPDIEPGLIARAKAEGVSVDALVEALVRRCISPPEATPPAELSPEEWMRRFRAWAHGHRTDTPLLSDEAISRESIYQDRGL